MGAEIARRIDLRKAAETIARSRYGIGKSKAEQRYRRWRLRHRLSINR